MKATILILILFAAAGSNNFVTYTAQVTAATQIRAAEERIATLEARVDTLEAKLERAESIILKYLYPKNGTNIQNRNGPKTRR